MTTTTVDPVADARREAAEAEQLLTALEERVRAGDESVTPAELATARELTRFATLRQEAARRKAEQLAAEARHAAYADLAVQADALASYADQHTDPLVQAYADVIAAQRKLWALGIQRSQRLRALFDQARHLAAIAKDHDELGMLNVQPASSFGVVSVATVDVNTGERLAVMSDIHAAELVADAYTVILGEERQRHGWTFGDHLWVGDYVADVRREIPALEKVTDHA